ncbi:hypothetical protein HDU83_003551 [Entophlyctis luteolus]|nr:hypothetical protein HDU83_003551 [Entophlyctis luteolus]
MSTHTTSLHRLRLLVLASSALLSGASPSGPSSASAAVPWYTDVVSTLMDLAKTNPHTTAYYEIGTTRSGLAIPAVVIEPESSAGTSPSPEKPADSPLSSVVILAQVQPREVLSLLLALRLANILSTADASATTAATVRTVIVPMVNPDGFEQLRLNPDYSENIIKNAAPGCADTEVTSAGVNLGHNWDFEWNYQLISGSDFSDPCGPAYRGPAPFSEPETQALRDLLLRERPKSALIVHARHLFSTSRLLVPFMFHKSTFASAESVKYKMLSDSDINAYRLLTSAMHNESTAEGGSGYSIGTSWETINQTISGSDLDWIFDNTGAFSIVLQMGTAEGTYWPGEDASKDLVEQHIPPVLKLLQLSPTVPPKTTKKTANSSLLGRVSLLPLYLGATVFAAIACMLAIASYCLGYDNVIGRFRLWVKRLERQVASRISRKRYVGVRTSSPPPRGGAARAAPFGRPVDEDVGLEELVVADEDDDDDEGTGFSYRM